MILVEVYTQNPIGYNKKLTYQSPTWIEKGCRVEIELVNKIIVGFVDSCYEGEVDYEVKPIVSIIDELPILNKELLELAEVMSYQSIAPMIRCLQAILPNPLKPTKSFKAPKKDRWLIKGDSLEPLTKRQQEIMDEFTEMSYTEGLTRYKSVLRTLIKKGHLLETEIEHTYQPEDKSVLSREKKLTYYQEKALNSIELNRFKTYLLFGATGSGKTEVYLQCAQKVLDSGKQVLILVPEISLTPQMIERFESRFGQDIGIYHSGLNNQQKYEQYKRVKDNQVSIVVGTRSCVFLPFDNLGLIVLDEEHDSSFKQETTPYYHAREMALYRGNYHQCPVVLGSATPSLESYAKALKGVYTLLELPERINESFPKSKIVNMSAEIRSLQDSIISKELNLEIQKRLDKKEQVMLLLNRRSYAPVVQCPKCLKSLQCPHCDTVLSYHKDPYGYVCHTCGYMKKDNTCPDCHVKATVVKGIGTQRLEEIVQAKYPKARIGRMDTDTTKVKNAHFKLLKAFNDHKIDILIGTQMIAKGLDIPNVTLVGILQADAALMHDDFSSTEKAFNLILQAAGRAGRHDLPGEVLVQSSLRDHYAIGYGLAQNYKGFFNEEMKYRHVGRYPPYVSLCEIIVSAKNENKVQEVGVNIASFLKTEGFTALGPVVIRKLMNQHRVRIVIKSKQKQPMIDVCHKAIEQLSLDKESVRITFNVDPNQLSQ